MLDTKVQHCRALTMSTAPQSSTHPRHRLPGAPRIQLWSAQGYCAVYSGQTATCPIGKPFCRGCRVGLLACVYLGFNHDRTGAAAHLLVPILDSNSLSRAARSPESFLNAVASASLVLYRMTFNTCVIDILDCVTHGQCCASNKYCLLSRQTFDMFRLRSASCLVDAIPFCKVCDGFVEAVRSLAL